MLRAELTTTADQLRAAHAAEVEALAASHATKESALVADHAKALSAVNLDLNAAEDDQARVKASAEDAQAAIGTLEAEVQRLMTLVENGNGGEDAAVQAVKAELEAVKDELATTKEVGFYCVYSSCLTTLQLFEMNKESFQHTTDELRAAHERELKETAEARKVEADAIKAETAALKEEHEATLTALRNELEVSAPRV